MNDHERDALEQELLELHFGADDIDGTIGEERIMHAADATSPIRQTRDRLIELIRTAQCVPVERDALYHPLQVFEDGGNGHAGGNGNQAEQPSLAASR